jgi:hypothetical protein
LSVNKKAHLFGASATMTLIALGNEGDKTYVNNPVDSVFYGFKQAHDVPEFYSGVGRHVGVLQNLI